VPFQTKLQFVEKLRLISPSSLKQITDHITTTCPAAFTESEDGKAQILVDLLTADAFRQVNEYVWVY
jgi:hypothetical protein